MTLGNGDRCPVCQQQISGVSREKGCPYCLLKLGIRVASGPRNPTVSSLGSAATEPSERFSRAGVLQRFGDYELVSEIARGGMGVVYRARQLSLNRDVAVKLILAGQLASPESLQRFRLEAQAAAQLHHPGIVRIYEIGEHDTQHFFSMELIDGVSLAECLDAFRLDQQAAAAERSVQERRIAQLISRVAKALDFAHQHGVLHRDVKPSNILIDEDEQPHLTDFGLAKLTGRTQSGLTLSNAVLGTPGYLSPEQATGKEDVTIASDVYGLGATLYELLTDSPPFSGATAVETMWKSIHETPLPPRKLNPVVHRDLETIAMRCLERKPEQRYPSAAAVADELDRFLQRKPIQARPVSAVERTWRWCQRNPMIATLISVVLLAITVGAGIAFWQWGRAELALVKMSESLAHLQWDAIDDTLKSGQSSRALAKTASLLRADPTDWKAAMFAMSVIEQRRFPVPVAPPIRSPNNLSFSVARLSPDGRRIVTASLDGTARLWDSATSEQVFPELRHEAAVNWAEFSPDGRTVATASDDQSVRLWDVATGQPSGPPLSHAEGVKEVRFSADGRHLLTRAPHHVSFFDVADRKLALGPLASTNNIVAAKFTADGQSIFVAEKSGIELWDLKTGERKNRLEINNIRRADLSRDQSRVVTLTSQTVTVWELATGQKLQAFDSPNGPLSEVLFSPDSQRLGVTSLNQWARVWSAETGLPITPELPHYYLLNGIQFLGAGERLMTWAEDSLAQVWDATTGEPANEPMRHHSRVAYAETGMINGREVVLTTISHLKSRFGETQISGAQLWQIHDKRKPNQMSKNSDVYGHDGVRISPDLRLIAIARSGQDVEVVDAETGERVCPPLEIQGGGWGLLFTPDSRRLVTTTSAGEFSVWSLPDGKRLFKPVKFPATIQPAEISGDGKWVLTGSTDGFLRLWDVSTGQVIREMKHGSEINSVAFSPNLRRFASAGEDQITKIWGAETGELQHSLKGHRNEVTAVRFVSDSRLVTASNDFTARIWDVATGAELQQLPHHGEVTDVAVSPDGSCIATASRDRTAMLWDAKTGRPRGRSLMHTQGVRNVRFSPDGKRLLTADFRSLRLWDVDRGTPLTAQLPQVLPGGTGFNSSTNGPSFSSDGMKVLQGMDCDVALMWEVPVPTPDIPAWFPEFLEAVAGERFTVGADLPEAVPPSSFLKLKQQLLNSTDTNDYAVWARNWLNDL